MIGSVEHVALGRWGEHREGPPLIAVAARGAYDRYDGLVTSIPSYSERAWRGEVDDADAFGPVLGPLASDFRSLCLLSAPNAPAWLLLTVAPLDRCVVLEWSPEAPDRWCRRILESGVDFEPEVFQPVAPVPSVLATVRPCPESRWAAAELIATLRARRQLTRLVEAGELSWTERDDIVDDLHHAAIQLAGAPA